MLFDIIAISAFFAGIVILDRRWQPKTEPEVKVVVSRKTLRTDDAKPQTTIAAQGRAGASAAAAAAASSSKNCLKNVGVMRHDSLLLQQWSLK
jgi:hypothetical protein